MGRYPKESWAAVAQAMQKHGIHAPARIAKETGMSRKTIYRALERFSETGSLFTTHGGRPKGELCPAGRKTTAAQDARITKPNPNTDPNPRTNSKPRMKHARVHPSRCI